MSNPWSLKGETGAESKTQTAKRQYPPKGINMRFPEVPSGLLKLLEDNFPDRLPTSDVGPFGLGKLVGQQEVIALIRHHYLKQQEATNVLHTQAS